LPSESSEKGEASSAAARPVIDSSADATAATATPGEMSDLISRL